jgi:CheY-like chemotaxis protein
MNKEMVILVVEDDEGHATLIERNLKQAGVGNRIERFADGQAILDFLFCSSNGKNKRQGAYVLLLDIRMPKVDGIEVLRRVKGDEELKKIPVVILTTTDDPREIELCHQLGCSVYITKPIKYEQFVGAVRTLGSFLSILQVPKVN